MAEGETSSAYSEEFREVPETSQIADVEYIFYSEEFY